MTQAVYHHRRRTRRPAPIPGLFLPEHGRLERRGTHFYTETGAIFGFRGKSMFLLFLRFCRGEDIIPDLLWLRAFGFNVVRIFGPLDWPETPDYRVENFPWDKLPRFFALLEVYGLRCNWSLGHYRHPDLKAHVQRWYDVAKEFWAPTFAEAVNEPHVGSQKPDPVALLDGINRYGIHTSYGLYGSYYQKPSVLPAVLDYGGIHTSRDSAWPRKARHGQELQALLGDQQPWLLDEPAKAIEVGSASNHPPTTAVHPGYRYPGGKTNPDEFAWYHGVGALWLPGSTFHDEEGKWGCVPRQGSQQYRCAEAVRDHVWMRIGPEWQTGEYNRAGNHDSPVDNVYTPENEIWTYSSVHADKGQAVAVRCGLIPLKATAGWHLREVWGPSNSFAFLER